MFMYKIIFLTSLLLTCVFNNIQAVEDSWDGKDYAQNSESQKQSAANFLRGHLIHDREKILDVGCGDGKITAQLAQLVPQGTVVGVDISSSMIAAAKKWEQELNNLTFEVKDAASLGFVDDFDLITSFTVMQWVLEQSKALEEFALALKEGGRLWIQMPIALPAPMQQALQEVTSKRKWKDYFKDFSPPWRFYQPEEYRELLEKAHFTPSRMEVVYNVETFPSKEAFTSFLRQWFPYLRPLPKVAKEPFLTELIEAYLRILPLDEKGQVLFIVDRLEVEAVKNILSPPAVETSE
jgi:trans-aconitate methyltransferase